VDARSEIREFLTSRRARITLQQAGLPVFGDTRHVPGLRSSPIAHPLVGGGSPTRATVRLRGESGSFRLSATLKNKGRPS
jgi:hypothetical protein